MQITADSTADLVVLSHLRWDWVWQRPQHLVSRFAARRAAAGGRTWFVEEPQAADVPEARLVTEDTGDDVTRVRLLLPRGHVPAGHLSFDVEAAAYAALLGRLLRAEASERRDVLLYTPMALEVAESLAPERLLYDVMDDLASFHDAPAGLTLRFRRALTEADVVFAGGRSLHRSVTRHRSGPTVLCPSGVEASHFACASQLRRPHRRPVAGYVGVLDERLDLELLGGLATRLPEWTVRLVGPVTKIDHADLPTAPNLEYPGMAAYDDLPEVLAGLDVALMPFALNEATRSISPTKTLEYLAAGLPVVSTRVPDVVEDHGHRVVLADDADGFADACRAALHEAPEHRAARMRLVSRDHEWDAIADRMMAAMADDHTAGAQGGSSA